MPFKDKEKKKLYSKRYYDKQHEDWTEEKSNHRRDIYNKSASKPESMAKRREYRDKNKEHIKEKAKEYRASHREEMKKYQAKRNKELRFTNPEAYRRRVESDRKARAKQRAIISEYKTQRGCAICGENHTACLDFHHNTMEKSGVVSRMASSARLDVVFAEMDKCIVLCANCHRKLHYNELNSGQPVDTEPEKES